MFALFGTAAIVGLPHWTTLLDRRTASYDGRTRFSLATTQSREALDRLVARVRRAEAKFYFTETTTKVWRRSTASENVAEVERRRRDQGYTVGPMVELTKEELLAAAPGTVDTSGLSFLGLRGDPSRHLSRAELADALRALPPAPLDRGRVDLLVARGPQGERHLPTEVVLTASDGMPGDRWSTEKRQGPAYQLATARTDFARVVANGQPLELHGDNLYLSLDLSKANLPVGSRVRLGRALTEVTPQAHNGCKKWVQRFGLDAMQLNMTPEFQALHLRGIYLRVIEAGSLKVGDAAVVVSRGPA
jgi:hypothetical protein